MFSFMTAFRRSIVLLLLLSASAIGLRAEGGGVYVLELTEEIDVGLPEYVRRVVEQATESNADAIVVHLNTFGGRVDVATEIKDILLHTSVPTIAWVENRAISAGALIALSCRHIAMAPGSSMGATTPVNSDGSKASPKIVSYLQGEMRSTAERYSRDPKVAAEMVERRDSLGEPTLTPLTLTTSEAERVGYCDAEAATLQEALDELGYGGRPIIRVEMSWSDQLLQLLTFPAVSALLIMIGLGGVFYAIKTGHVGGIALIGFCSIVLFFATQFFADMAGLFEVVMFLLGIALLAAEIFLIPGFGVAGVLGILMIISSLFLALVGSLNLLTFNTVTVPLLTLAGSFVGLAVMIGLMARYLPTSHAFSRIVLSASVQSALPESTRSIESIVGMVGEAMTTLRPAGVAQFGNERLDVITAGEFISAGESVRVVRVDGRKIVVSRASVT